ncbi:MAG TPA: hypothetical protein VD735_00840, partial [Candidatus Saccharimonadales bacterium]|nr:hypothetical protein [Candidatus Saccharimonadales bacterium]
NTTPASAAERPLLSRRNLLRGAVATGLVAAGAGTWEAVRDPVLNHFSPDLRAINPAWQDVAATNIPWQSMSGDPDRKEGEQRPRDKVAVFGIRPEAMYDLLDEYPGSALAAAYQLSATMCRLTTIGGPNNLGQFMAEREPGGTPDRYHGVAFMLGAGSLNGAVGVATPEHRFITTPHGIAYPRPLTLDELPHELPGMPVLRA